MSNLIVNNTSEVAARPCAFCQASPLTSASSRLDANESSANSGSHLCMLHAGRMGPDGKAISPHDCTSERQVGCQSHRRLRFARLCAQPITLSTAPAAR
jgi:hypothetical protein